ncbi:zinc finger BED domain-containing protein 5 [Trichonephila clavipes]|uniref:Zinc finger BED domain-containing protein 5 n=1 Tax=Trichonephila clavipes TaxID=2585209 RepID=A0A8X6VSA0_TRICX|nr:zinc finger BED domain-containing protein 5 [Trichonephila clavipes]
MDKFLSRKRTFDDNKASTSAQTSTVPKIKSRKYSHEYLNFGFTITEVNGEEKPLCVISSKILAADSVKPNKLKRHFETLHAICKKPHTIAEELILPAAIEIVQTMFGDNFTKELQSIPLSNDTVSRRIDDIAEDVEQQLFGKLRDKLFSIQLDEATDSNKDAHFIAYVRFWDGMSAVEELLFCKLIKLKATGIALFDILNNFINETNIEWKNCVGICTDGARTMSGRFKSIQALVKQKSPLCIWTHCKIHREVLASKEISRGLNIVLMTVVTVVNYITMRPLKSRIFSGLCKDMGAVHSSLLFYCEARRLSRGKFLQRVYELRNEITIFLEEENLPEAEKFRDGLFLMKLSYLVDIFEKLNILNLQLQGSNVHMFDTSDKINAFFRKLELWSRNLKPKKA